MKVEITYEGDEFTLFGHYQKPLREMTNRLGQVEEPEAGGSFDIHEIRRGLRRVDMKSLAPSELAEMEMLAIEALEE